MNDNGQSDLELLESLRDEHRDLDAAIYALENLPMVDRIQIQRIKKRKLSLKEKIDFIEDEMMPDIIA
jgi:hypothetical protein